jgi:hypothetical protein
LGLKFLLPILLLACSFLSLKRRGFFLSLGKLAVRKERFAKLDWLYLELMLELMLKRIAITAIPNTLTIRIKQQLLTN